MKGKLRVWKGGMHSPFDCGCEVNVEPSDDIPEEATCYLFPCLWHREAMAQ